MTISFLQQHLPRMYVPFVDVTEAFGFIVSPASSKFQLLFFAAGVHLEPFQDVRALGEHLTRAGADVV